MTLWKKRILLYIVTLLVLVVIVQWPYISSKFKSQRVVTPEVTDNTNANKFTPNLLQVPDLGVEVPVQYAQEKNEDYFQKLLIDGVVHFPGTAEAGAVGNCYIFGHSSDYVWSKGKFKTVFSKLPNIKNDTLIYISNSAGQRFTYKVVSSRVVAADDVSVLSQETGGKAVLTLQTSYPVGTALRRFIAVAELVN